MSERTETEIKSMTKEQNYMCGYRDGKSDAIKALEQEPKTGHWKDADYMDEWWGQVYICSECGESMIGKSNYCPDCGARMNEVSE